MNIKDHVAFCRFRQSSSLYLHRSYDRHHVLLENEMMVV